MRRISFVLLLLEAAVLIYPSFIGLLLVLSAFVPLATGSISSAQLGEAAIAALALAGLLIGWTLLATRLVEGLNLRARCREPYGLLQWRWRFSPAWVSCCGSPIHHCNCLVSGSTSFLPSSIYSWMYGWGGPRTR